MTQPSPEEDVIFWVSAALAIILGTVAALYGDIYFQMDQAHAWQRLPIALILGGVAGGFGLIIVCLGIVVVIAWAIIASQVGKTGSQQTGSQDVDKH